MKKNLPPMILVFILLMTWQLGAMKMNAAYILPSPVQIVEKLWELREPLFTVPPSGNNECYRHWTCHFHWTGTVSGRYYGYKSNCTQGFISGDHRVSDHPYHGHCPPVCPLVWLQPLEQSPCNNINYIFSDYNHCI